MITAKWVVFFLLFIGATVALWAGIRSADAHDWYPMECCHGMDCAPVDKVQLLSPVSANATPAMIVTTKYGTVVVPPDFPRREFGRQPHACLHETRCDRPYTPAVYLPAPTVIAGRCAARLLCALVDIVGTCSSSPAGQRRSRSRRVHRVSCTPDSCRSCCTSENFRVVPKAAVSTRSDVCQSGRQQDYRCLGDWGCHYAVLARPLSSSRAMAHCCGTCAVEGGFRSHRAGSDPEERQHAHPAIERLLSRLPLSLFSSPIVRLRPAASLCNTPPERPTSNMREVGRA